MTLILGFDPGGRNQFGWCLCRLQSDESLQLSQCGVVSDAESAFNTISTHIGTSEAPAAAGIDAPMYWVSKGGRRADDLVRKAIRLAGAPSPGGTVQHFNSLRGACLIQGMLIARCLRDRYPDMPIVETHPKALLWLLRLASDTAEGDIEQLKSLCQLPDSCDVSRLSEHERDAVVGAYATSKLILQDRAWVDLLLREQAPICAVDGPLSYYMPKLVLQGAQGAE